MNKFKKVLNSLKYLPIVALPFLAQDLKGQIIFPKGVLNPFIPQDTTEAAKAFEKLSTQSARNIEIFKRVRAGWVYTIPTNFNPALPDWDCNERELQQIVNAMNCTGVYTLVSSGSKLLFDGYNKFIQDSIINIKALYLAWDMMLFQ